jgi:hypothetical protein
MLNLMPTAVMGYSPLGRLVMTVTRMIRTLAAANVKRLSAAMLCSART